MRAGLGAGGEVALAGLVVLVSVAALASPAQGARYAASVQVRESPTRIGSVSGFGKEVSNRGPDHPPRLALRQILRPR
jgi:hypothetical protein